MSTRGAVRRPGLWRSAVAHRWIRAGLVDPASPPRPTARRGRRPTPEVRPGRVPGWAGTAAVRFLPPLLLLVLGLIQLNRNRPLWYDEAYTRLAAGVPLTTLLSGMWHRVGVVSYLMDVPPSFNGPFYVVMHGWVQVFGDSAFSLRFASLICAAAALGVLAELVRRLAGTETALVAGLLLASGPLMLTETTQARDYGPGLLALSLCALWLYDWIARRQHLSWAVAAGAVAGLMHWFTLPVLAGLAVLALLAARGRAGRRAALALGAGAGPAVLLVGWSLLGGAYGAPHPVPVGWSLPIRAVEDWSAGLGIASLALAAAAGVGLVWSRHRRLVVCWFVVPVLLITAVELARPTYYPRYLLFTLVGLVVGAAFGVSALPWAGVRRTVAALLVALSLYAAVPTYDSAAYEPTPQVISFLAAHHRSGEPIVPADGRTSLDLETYLSQAPELSADLVLPPELFTDQTTSRTVWLVRVVLKENSLPVVPAEQRLIDAGWTMTASTQLTGATTDLRVEQWSR